jgi:small ligand-binding sensory domain FIST
LVHASAEAQDLQDLIAELAARMTGERVFGGVPSSRHGSGPQFAVSGLGNVAGMGGASGVYEGGVSGVAFSDRVRLLQRVTQGCRPVSRVHEVTSAERNLLGTLDGERALDVLLRDLQIEGAGLPTLIAPVRATLVGLAGSHGATLKATGDLDENARVRHIIGVDPTRRALAVAEQVDEGQRLVFCERSREAARADLLRICTEIREDIEAGDAPVGARGALYVSCSGRGGPHFGGPNAELDLIRHALGEIPLVGFFAGGEIAGQQLLGYTGVLTVFA